MTPTQRGERYLVVDNFLTSEALALVREQMRDTILRPRDSLIDAAIDGAALRSRGGLLKWPSLISPGGPEGALQSVVEALRSHPEICGTPPLEWSVMSFSFWQYPAGSRLGWHNDAGEGRTGEYILYLHEEWNPDWGGELIILDSASPETSRHVALKDRPEAFAAEFDASAAVMTAIYPRPNRLVMMKAGTHHYINRVDKAADGALRSSLSGFTSRLDRRREQGERQQKLGAVLGWFDAPHTKTGRAGGC